MIRTYCNVGDCIELIRFSLKSIEPARESMKENVLMSIWYEEPRDEMKYNAYWLFCIDLQPLLSINTIYVSRLKKIRHAQ